MKRTQSTWYPVQFHTGLGDNDLDLLVSSPGQMQQIIRAYPKTNFVLLHSSYPYTREAGYLTAMYKNVYLDFGEVSKQEKSLNRHMLKPGRSFHKFREKGKGALSGRFWSCVQQIRLCGRVSQIYLWFWVTLNIRI